MLFLRGNFKNVTIDFAMHSHSAPISVCGAFQLRENNLTYMYVKNLKHMTIARIFFTFPQSIFRIFIICHGFYKH